MADPIQQLGAVVLRCPLRCAPHLNLDRAERNGLVRTEQPGIFFLFRFSSYERWSHVLGTAL